jgi:hypothetical protein
MDARAQDMGESEEIHLSSMAPEAACRRIRGIPSQSQRKEVNSCDAKIRTAGSLLQSGCFLFSSGVFLAADLHGSLRIFTDERNKSFGFVQIRKSIAAIRCTQAPKSRSLESLQILRAESAKPGVYTLAPGAGGAAGAIAWGGAPQRGAQPQEYEVRDQISPGGGVRFKKWWLKAKIYY